MKVVYIAGTLNAGKSTFVAALLRALKLDPNKVAYILNEAKASNSSSSADEVVTHLKARFESIVSGCFTCQSPRQLKAKIDELSKAGVELVFLEPFGATSGFEALSFMSDLSCPWAIVSLVDASEINENVATHGDMIKSHVQASTGLIVVTKTTDATNVDVISDKIATSENRQFLGWASGTGIPEEIVGAFQAMEFVAPGSVDKGQIPAFKPSGTTSVHRKYVSHYSLKPGVSPAQIAGSVKGCGFLIRVKGAINGVSFSITLQTGDVEYGELDPRTGLYFYATRPLDLGADLPELAKLVLPDGLDTRSAITQMREDTLPRAETVALIKRGLAEFPLCPIVISSPFGLRVLTHPESMQVTQNVSRRPSVKDEWQAEVYERCVGYWYQCLAFVLEHKGKIDPEALPVHLRELGNSLAWWTDVFKSSFAGDLLASVHALKPGLRVAEGVLSMTELSSDLAGQDRPYWQREEYLRAFRYCFNCLNQTEQAVVYKALAHLKSLAKTPDEVKLWQDTVL